MSPTDQEVLGVSDALMGPLHQLLLYTLLDFLPTGFPSTPPFFTLMRGSISRWVKKKQLQPDAFLRSTRSIFTKSARLLCERRAATVRLNAVESQCVEAAATRLLMVKEKAIRQHQHLRNNLAQAEQPYWATVQQEARKYSEVLRARNCFTIRFPKHWRSLCWLPRGNVHNIRCRSRQSIGKKLWTRSLNGEKRPLSRSAP